MHIGEDYLYMNLLLGIDVHRCTLLWVQGTQTPLTPLAPPGGDGQPPPRPPWQPHPGAGSTHLLPGSPFQGSAAARGPAAARRLRGHPHAGGRGSCPPGGWACHRPHQALGTTLASPGPVAGLGSPRSPAHVDVVLSACLPGGPGARKLQRPIHRGGGCCLAAAWASVSGLADA